MLAPRLAVPFSHFTGSTPCALWKLFPHSLADGDKLLVAVKGFVSQGQSQGCCFSQESERRQREVGMRGLEAYLTQLLRGPMDGGDGMGGGLEGTDVHSHRAIPRGGSGSGRLPASHPFRAVPLNERWILGHGVAPWPTESGRSSTLQFLPPRASVCMPAAPLEASCHSGSSPCLFPALVGTHSWGQMWLSVWTSPDGHSGTLSPSNGRVGCGSHLLS